MTRLPPDFKEFLQLLGLRSVEYLLVGGYAVIYYGYPRSTADLDVWIRPTDENIDRLVAALHEFGFAHATAELFREEGQIVRMGVPPVRIEILNQISGVSFDECFDAHVVAELDGIQVHLINLADLKSNKAAAGRHKDLDDLENLP